MSTYQSPNINNRSPMLVDSGLFGDIRYDTDDVAPIYIGSNVTNDASTTGTDWKILKFTYANGNVTRIQLVYGAWDSRATLF